MKLAELLKVGPSGLSSILYPYVIAEAGVNHGGDIEVAKRLIDEAKEGGADAIKFQTYRAGTIASRHSPAYWDLSKEPTQSQYELFKKYDKFWKNEFEVLAQYCETVDIEFMSTPFDIESAKFLNDLMAVYKISSSDITNKPFIEYMCAFGKPIILSTGASNLDEIADAVSWIDNFGNKLALMHCVLNYPTLDENANLGMIRSLREEYPDRIIGYSDHTMPNEMKILELATLLGSVVLEKHFTHDKKLPGNDHYHAMDKDDLKLFLSNLKQIFVIMGSFKKFSLPEEQLARKNARRSLVASTSISKGSVIKLSDLTWKRPASGVSPCQIDDFVGRVALVDISEDDILELSMIQH
jgi:sialic acid synthase SpsE